MVSDNISKMSSTVRKGIVRLGILLALSPLAYCGPIPYLINRDLAQSERINSQSELDEIIDSERKKIDPSSSVRIVGKINLSDCSPPFNRLDSIAFSERLPNGTYAICLGKRGRNKSAVRHELYHILDGHFESGSSWFVKSFLYFTLNEPKAIIYQLTGKRI